MATLHTVIYVTWAAFWVSWVIAAASAKPGSRRDLRARGSTFAILAITFIVVRAVHPGAGSLANVPVAVLGTALFLGGLALAVWARVHLGRNWGMPMTTKDEPELVTSGPYSRIRHPIYSGILLAVLGTALAASLYALIPFGALTVRFVYSARVEEQTMQREFPNAYASYRARTKMLIPFLV